MLIERYSTQKKFKQAQRRHRPSPDLLENGGHFVRASLALAPDTAGILNSVHAQAPQYEESFVQSMMATGAVALASMSLIGNDNGLRMYLLGDQHLATELPTRPLKSNHLERPEAVDLKLEPSTWSLLKVAEEDAGLNADSMLRYGFAIMQAIQDNAGLDLAFVDRRGKSEIAATTTPITTLGGPSEIT